MMKQLNLGNSGLNASAVALGCMRIGELPAEKLERLFFAALEAGINFFDHADIYASVKPGSASCWPDIPACGRRSSSRANAASGKGSSIFPKNISSNRWRAV